MLRLAASVLALSLSFGIGLIDCHSARADDPCARSNLKASAFVRMKTVHIKWTGQIANPMREQVLAEFDKAKGQARNVVLILSSCGGNLGEAERVIDVLKNIKKTHHLETRVDPGSMCASACIPIFLQGMRRRAALTSAWLFHEVTRPNAADKTKKQMDRAITERLFEDYYLPSGVSEAWLNRLRIMVQQSDYWQTGENLWESKSGIITEPIANHLPRTINAELNQGRPNGTAEMWAAVKDTLSIPALEEFIAQFPDTFYADRARTRIVELKRRVAIAEPLKPTLVRPSPLPRCNGVVVTVGAGEHKCMKPGAGKMESFKDCADCPEMVVVPAGEFMMGSDDGDADERPAHKVIIAKPFAVGKFEVTFAEWDACVSTSGCKHKPSDQSWGRGKRPVINVSWDDTAKEYLPWLSRRTGKSYQLPTEAEWEYAARAGSPTNYVWGDQIGKNMANCDGCGSQWDNKQTAPVGSFQQNGFGLYDMHGNAWEWVEECYNIRATPALSRCLPIVRGGSWNVPPKALRLAGRAGSPMNSRDFHTGFRVARKLE